MKLRYNKYSVASKQHFILLSKCNRRNMKFQSAKDSLKENLSYTVKKLKKKVKV